jgi:hypothetical protein
VTPFLTAILQSDPNWDRQNTLITRRFIISVVLLAVAAICLFLLALPLVYALVAPSPFEYRNLPFKVCAPQSTTDLCIPSRNDPFHPGDVVPLLVDRCVNDPFARGANVPYIISRNLIAENGTRIILPGLSTNVVADGCTTMVTLANALPDGLAPGQYRLEGVATVYGRFRTVNVYFVTEPFTVI